MRLLYFAWVREQIGREEEYVDLPGDVDTLGALVALLAARGGGYEQALADMSRLRAAVNENYADWDHPVHEGDEVALFPPVTGG